LHLTIFVGESPNTEDSSVYKKQVDRVRISALQPQFQVDKSKTMLPTLKAVGKISK